MLLIPAIDLKDGSCVRLRQGDFNDSTIFSTEPNLIAKKWCNKGAHRLHLVDLDGAISGKPKNQVCIKSILDMVRDCAEVQVGGGIRNLEIIKDYLEMGVSYVIIGTAAITDPYFLREACANFPGRILVGLDVRDGKIAINGWNEITSLNILDLAKKIEIFGCSGFIYTDIKRDGMLSGLDFDQPLMLVKEVQIPVYISGGIRDIGDIQLLCSKENKCISGAILGRSLYEGTLDFEKARSISDQCI